MNKVWIVLIVILIVGGFVYLSMKGDQLMKETSPAVGMEQTVVLSEQNESEEFGTAVLFEKDGKVIITLNMTGAPLEIPQPAHIHSGSCPDVGAVVYPLTNLVNGKSETTLDVTFAELAGKQPLGINVHKSVPDAKVYVSCGDLALPASSTAPSPANYIKY